MMAEHLNLKWNQREKLFISLIPWKMISLGRFMAKEICIFRGKTKTPNLQRSGVLLFCRDKALPCLIHVRIYVRIQIQIYVQIRIQIHARIHHLYIILTLILTLWIVNLKLSESHKLNRYFNNVSKIIPVFGLSKNGYGKFTANRNC